MPRRERRASPPRDVERLPLPPDLTPALVDLELDTLAASTGVAWATAYAAELRAQRRSVSGGWPGTMTEARARVIASLRRGDPMSSERLQVLARAAYRAARDAWQRVAEPDVDTDLEPEHVDG